MGLKHDKYNNITGAIDIENQELRQQLFITNIFCGISIVVAIISVLVGIN